MIAVVIIQSFVRLVGWWCGLVLSQFMFQIADKRKHDLLIRGRRKNTDVPFFGWFFQCYYVFDNRRIEECAGFEQKYSPFGNLDLRLEP